MKHEEKRFEFIKTEFINTWKLLERTFHFYLDYQYNADSENVDFWQIELQENDYWSKRYAWYIYNIISVYLEMNGLHTYLKYFQKKYKDMIENKHSYKKVISFPLGDGDYEQDSEFLHELSLDLSPFDLLSGSKKFEPDMHLISVLENTSEILKLTKTEVKKETSINLIVRDILDLFYENIKVPDSGVFRKKFKSYMPDILVPELNSAIEYKLIRNNKDIGVKIDELKIDADGYTGNDLYYQFYAVFCLTKAITKTAKQIKAEWKNRKFPKNWVLIVIKDIELSGSSKSKTK